MTTFKTTKSGVKVFDDFHDNLIIDRYDNIFSSMRGSKMESLRSENSEDALSWNVFRTLNQIDPGVWLPQLFKLAFDENFNYEYKYIDIILWQEVCPPLALKLIQKDEGNSEIDIIIESENFVWFIEAKYKSDISEGTTNNLGRNQIIRNIDVGSYYAGIRDFYFSLLYLDEKHSNNGVKTLRKYQLSKNDILDELKHRTDGLNNLRSLGLIKWSDIKLILQLCTSSCSRKFEADYAKRAVEWLDSKNI